MRIVGIQALAELFGVTHQSIDNWQKEGLPVAKPGGPGVPSEFDSSQCIQWYASRAVNKAGAVDERDLLDRTKRQILEIDLAKKRGEMIPAAALEPRLKAVMLSAREALRNEAPRLAGLLEGMDHAARARALRDSFDKFLVRLSRIETSVTVDEVLDAEAAEDDEDEAT